jgi:hypothetical protein
MSRPGRAPAVRQRRLSCCPVGPPGGCGELDLAAGKVRQGLAALPGPAPAG